MVLLGSFDRKIFTCHETHLTRCTNYPGDLFQRVVGVVGSNDVLHLWHAVENVLHNAAKSTPNEHLHL